jgi:hypothetical protein
MIIIDKGIPLPIEFIEPPFNELEKGDSMTFDFADASRIRSRMFKWNIKNRHKKLKSKKVESQLRVWRTK